MAYSYPKITDDQFRDVLSHYTAGNTITESCKLVGIDVHQFYGFMNDKETGQQAQQSYACACSINTELLADEIIRIARSKRDPRDKQVEIDAIKWLLSKKQPKKYGERIEITDPGSKLPTVLKIELVQPKPQISTDKQDITDVSTVSD